MILSTCVSEASNFIYSGFWLILDLSYFIGQNLVHNILAIFGFTSRLLGLIVSLFRVIYKDFLFFFQDVTDNFSCFVAFVVGNIFNIADGMMRLSSAVIRGVTTLPKLFYEFLDCLSASTNFIKAILTLLWDGFLLIGSSFWLAVMYVPWGILYCIKLFFEQLLHLPYNIINFFWTVTTLILNGVQHVFNFFYNIPYSSALGSVLTIILFYVFIRNFNRICILSFKVSAAFYQYISSLTTSHIVGKAHSPKRNSRSDYDIYCLIEEKLCVICQDKFKEVVVLPCRHLCLCTNCRTGLMQNKKVCPICRTNIEGMMTVYI